MDVQALLPFALPLVKVIPISVHALFISKATVVRLVTLTLFTISRQTSVCVYLGEEKQVSLNLALITAVYIIASITIIL